MKKKLLMGFVMNGKAGGVDKYILNCIKILSNKYKIDVLTNQDTEELRENLDKQGIKLIVVSSLKNPIQQYKELVELLDSNKYDVVYLNTSTAIMLPLVIAAKKCKVPKRIVHSHSSGIDVNNKLKKMVLMVTHNCCKPVMCKMANQYFACSKKAGEWLFGEKNVNTDLFEIIPNAIELSKYKFDEECRWNLRKELNVEDSLVLGHISNFQPVKNTVFLVDLLYELSTVIDNVKLLLIGDGPEKIRCYEKARELGIESKIIDVGYQTNTAQFYQVMDFFLLPSYFEGFPIVSVEAQAAQVACVLSSNITEEAKLAEKTYFHKIENGIKEWKECILRNYPYQRTDNYQLEEINNYDSEKVKSKILNCV